jgi:ADP-ribosylglycohydrolase
LSSKKSLTDNLFKDRVMGCLIGGILGDLMGVPLEFKTESQIKNEYHGLSSWEDIRPLFNNRYSDDTCQMLCIIESLIQFKTINVPDIAERFYQWMLKDGFGIGNQTAAVLSAYKHNKDIHTVSSQIWEKSGRRAAGNGGVMRTAPLGIYFYNSPELLPAAVVDVCKITHFDPRCQDSCLAVCYAIADLLVRKFSPTDLIHKLPDGVTKSLLNNQPFPLLNTLKVDGHDMGFTLHTLIVAFTALIESNSFEEGLLSVFRKGGDVDTNGIVAGCLLGAKFGLSGIPIRWIQNFQQYRELEPVLEQFYSILPSPI